ncbi:LysE family translocator [Variovorax boronicumulans]|uniref:LysE family translocator n=1 Tax=Variovorax boronicumulans TaxID=436515 RepID=UPI001C5975E2
MSDLALSGRQREARWVVLGLTAGSIFWVIIALTGVSALLDRHPWLSSSMRWAGSAYLIGYGIKLIRASRRPRMRETPRPAGDPSVRRGAFRSGIVTSVTNPKGAAFWTSAFATLMPPDAPNGFLLATTVLVGILSLAWHLGIVRVFGTRRLRAGYVRIEPLVDRVAGSALVLLGFQRIFSR